MTATHCTGCGRLLVGAPPGSASGGRAGNSADVPATRCPGCARAIDPPRYCPACGRWLAVTVTPTGWRARCRDHGELEPQDAGPR